MNPIERYRRAHPENVVWSPETGWTDGVADSGATTEAYEADGRPAVHYHAGHNMPGYLPESDVYTFASFEDAKLSTIDDIDRYGDCLFEMERKNEADEASGIMEELNLDDGPEWSAYVGDLVYWINECSEDCEVEDY